MRQLIALICFVLLGGAAPPRLIADLSQSKIDIVYTFAGAELLIFGAIQYPGSPPDTRSDIAIIVRGPPEAITVRKKARIAGIWVNTRAVRFETAPSFYSVATTKPIADLVDERTATIYELGLDHLQLSPVSSSNAKEIRSFESGFLNLRQSEGLYSDAPEGVQLTENVLYRTRVLIPSQVPVGNYTVEIHLIEKGEVLASTTRDISIDKSGFERDVYVASQKNSFSYGLIAVVLALLLGWVGGLFSRK